MTKIEADFTNNGNEIFIKINLEVNNTSPKYYFLWGSKEVTDLFSYKYRFFWEIRYT